MITIKITRKQFDYYLELAMQKIKIEGWGDQGRNVDVKTKNFACSFATENEFVKILRKYYVKHSARGFNYVGDAKNAPKDIIIWVNGEEKEIDVKSKKIDLLEKYQTMDYPCDQFYNNQIPDFLVFCSIDIRNEEIIINYYGFYSREALIDKIKNHSKKLYSSKNQEHFFNFEYPKNEIMDLIKIIDKCGGQTPLII